ncbi:aldose 1-epimerase family protein [Anaerostipes sp.]|uniref:aldose 1-epimerase family protein n=1 Tax=Anaerostipes sp. TaxID=1872530 RepID=UPI0025C636C6|nr:aldose 1-epimerase family protein [Anaerostipes sp.]
MYQIENEVCRISVKEHGSELCEMYDKTRGRDYIWKAGPVWPKHSPLLFPSIGGFYDETYTAGEKAYKMRAHGFARDMDFTPVHRSSSEIVMQLESSEDTYQIYPYHFCLQVSHRLEGKKLTVTWKILNAGTNIMYYSIGAHPGFQFAGGTKLSDYRLIFDRALDLNTHRVKGRLVTKETYPVAKQAGELALCPDLLRRDALIFEDGISSMTLDCAEADYHLKVSFPGFPAAAVWTMPSDVEEAEYLCIEPWCGINDFAGQGVQDISNKYLIQALNAGESCTKSYTIEIF